MKKLIGLLFLSSFCFGAKVDFYSQGYQLGYIGNPNDPNSANSVSNSSSCWTVPTTLPVPCTLTGFRVDQGASSGKIDLGVADINKNVLTHLGNTSSAGTGFQTYSLASNYSLGAGTYLLFVCSDNTTATFTRSGVDGVIGTYQCTTSYPVGTTLTNCSVAANAFSIVGLCSGGLLN